MAKPRSQPSGKRRKVPASVLERSDHDLLEGIVGKRVMRRVDALLESEGESRKSMK